MTLVKLEEGKYVVEVLEAKSATSRTGAPIVRIKMQTLAKVGYGVGEVPENRVFWGSASKLQGNHMDMLNWCFSSYGAKCTKLKDFKGKVGLVDVDECGYVRFDNTTFWADNLSIDMKKYI